MRFFLLMVSVATLALPSLAVAQSFQGPCKTQTLCAGVEPGGGRLLDCLRKHKKDLSVACKVSIADFFLNRAHQSKGGGRAGGGEGRGAGLDRGGPAEHDAPGSRDPTGSDERDGPEAGRPYPEGGGEPGAPTSR